MKPNPLVPPEDSKVLFAFMKSFGLQANRSPLELLTDVATAFARLPYENLTKIIKEAELGRCGRTRRDANEVLCDHLAVGTGGTCFALTATLIHLVRTLGFEAQPILADRRYGPNTHCALLVWIEGRPHLLDPGYLITRPLLLPSDSRLQIPTAFNSLLLIPLNGGERVELHTISKGKPTYRLTFKTRPVDAGEFLKWWDDSFDWEMMRYPVLNQVRRDRQLYLQGNRFQVRGHNEIRREEIPPNTLVQKVAAEFGIDPSITARALSILHERGESHGQS